jgi:hypothetical protein
MASIRPADGPGSVVVAYVPDPRDHACEHERRTLLEFARRLAGLRGGGYAAWYEPQAVYAQRPYFVPSATLTSVQAAPLGIHCADDLFGGVVPYAFVATKAISHGLVQPGAAAPAGWSETLARRVQPTVLPGYTAFTLEDARTAGQRLLARAPVRVKRVGASGGRGQAVAADAHALAAVLDAMDPGLVAGDGLVLEENVPELETLSVGQVRVADLTASYYGRQRTTPTPDGRSGFGGSDLHVVRGGFDALLALRLPAGVGHAIAVARQYDAAVQDCFPGFYASRSNYDVVVGRSASGEAVCAVLEQSWRAGGATGAEIAALEVFRAVPGRGEVRASCFEFFGDSPEPPPHATVYYRGEDPQLGRLTKYTVVHRDDDAR